MENIKIIKDDKLKLEYYILSCYYIFNIYSDSSDKYKIYLGYWTLDGDFIVQYNNKKLKIAQFLDDDKYFSVYGEVVDVVNFKDLVDENMEKKKIYSEEDINEMIEKYKKDYFDNIKKLELK